MKRLSTTVILTAIVVLLLLNLAAQIEINPQPKEQIVIKSPLVGITAVKPNYSKNVIMVFRARADGTTEALRIDEERIKDMPWHQWTPLPTQEPGPEQPDKPRQK